MAALMFTQLTARGWKCPWWLWRRQGGGQLLDNRIAEERIYVDRNVLLWERRGSV